MSEQDPRAEQVEVSKKLTVGPCPKCGKSRRIDLPCPYCPTGSQAETRPDAEFPKYVVLRRVGAGGMGEVFQAHPVGYPAQLRAIKVLRPELSASAGFRERFERERIAMQAIVKVPGVVAVHDAGTSRDERLFLVMDWVAGRSLADAMADPSSPFASPDHPDLPALAAQLVRQLGRALDGAHRADVIHRDIKPSNVMLSAEPPAGRLVAVLIDFGIASLGKPARPRAGSVGVGTPTSMAPEVLSGQPVTARTDVYLLAHLMYRVLTGLEHTVGQIRPPSEVHPRFPATMDRLFAAGLAGIPEDRPQSCGAFAQALSRELERVPAPRRGPSVVKKLGRAVAVGAALLVGAFLLLLAVGLLSSPGGEDAPPVEASAELRATASPVAADRATPAPRSATAAGPAVERCLERIEQDGGWAASGDALGARIASLEAAWGYSLQGTECERVRGLAQGLGLTCEVDCGPG